MMASVWVGRVLSTIAVVFLAFDLTIKVLKAGAAIQATTALGYSERVLVPLGVIEAICLVLYLLPPTAGLGAILWTGYLGGAVASQVRVGNPIFTNVLFPTYIGALLWIGLWLRNPGTRVLLGRPERS